MEHIRLAAALGVGAILTATLATSPLTPDQGPRPPEKKDSPKEMTSEERELYAQAIRRTAQMVGDPEAQRLAQSRGLNVLNLTWEDTGRYKGSAVGPNISDMTIQVLQEDPRTKRPRPVCMPVIRHPNFSDLTCDLDPRGFTLLVGNHKGQPLRRVSLYDFLDNPRAYLTNPDSWKGPRRSLVAPERDSKVLVSAQACFLPVPRAGTATFNPVLFNYQAVKGDPAVLTVLVTRQGTSATIIDNTRDAFSEGSAWGQRLFHNEKGQRASLTGQRLSDFKAAGGDPTSPTPSGPRKRDAGLNMVLLVQIPLKQKERMQGGGFGGGGFPAEAMSAAPMKKESRDRSDVEAAVIGHGDLEGPFTEIDGLPIERDVRFPVRVTVQFYKATSNGVVSAADMASIKEEIDRVYAQSDSVGSLVVGGETGRVTEYEGSKVQPRDWWQRFWERHERNTGDSREVAIQKLRRLLGTDFHQRPVCDLYLRDLLRK